MRTRRRRVGVGAGTVGGVEAGVTMIGIERYTYPEAGDAMVARNVFFCAGREGDVISTTQPLIWMIILGVLTHMGFTS